MKLERKNLVGQLKATKTVGFDPLIVEFDASITKLNDPNDEVVYFTRDFGDGEVRKNTSVGKITHTYKFDTVKESGEFQPSVTVKTKKGLTQTIIFAEKTVDFALQADGKVTAVTWDFGNGKKLNGQAREFMDTSMKYDIPGLYEIFVTLEFSDNPPVTQSIKLKVE